MAIHPHQPTLAPAAASDIDQRALVRHREIGRALRRDLYGIASCFETLPVERDGHDRFARAVHEMAGGNLPRPPAPAHNDLARTGSQIERLDSRRRPRDSELRRVCTCRDHAEQDHRPSRQYLRVCGLLRLGGGFLPGAVPGFRLRTALGRDLGRPPRSAHRRPMSRSHRLQPTRAPWRFRRSREIFLRPSPM